MYSHYQLRANFLRTVANLVWMAGLALSIFCWFSATEIEGWFSARFMEEWQVRGLTSALILLFISLGTFLYSILASWSAELEKSW